MILKFLNAIFSPFYRTEVRLLLKSGQSIYFRCSKVTVRREADGTLSSINADDTQNFPLYVRLDDISAVEYWPVFR